MRPSPGTTASAPTWSPPPARPPGPVCTTIAWRLPAPLVQHVQQPRQLGGLHRHPPHRAGQRPPGRQPPGRGVGAEQPRRCPRASPAIPKAIGYLERSLAIRREIGDRMGEAQAANNLADAYQRLGRTDEALDAVPACAGAEPRGRLPATAKASRWSTWDGRCSTLTGPRRPSTTCGKPSAPSPRSTIVDGVGYALHILGRCYLSLRPGRGGPGAACGRRWPATGPRATGAGRRPR